MAAGGFQKGCALAKACLTVTGYITVGRGQTLLTPGDPTQLSSCSRANIIDQNVGLRISPLRTSLVHNQSKDYARSSSLQRLSQPDQGTGRVRTQLLDDRIKDSHLSTYLPSHTRTLGILSCCLDQHMFPVIASRCYLCSLCPDSSMYLYSERSLGTVAFL